MLQPLWPLIQIHLIVIYHIAVATRGNVPNAPHYQPAAVPLNRENKILFNLCITTHPILNHSNTFWTPHFSTRAIISPSTLMMGGVRALITKDELELENDQLIWLFYEYKYKYTNQIQTPFHHTSAQSTWAWSESPRSGMDRDWGVRGKGALHSRGMSHHRITYITTTRHKTWESIKYCIFI